MSSMSRYLTGGSGHSTKTSECTDGHAREDRLNYVWERTFAGVLGSEHQRPLLAENRTVYAVNLLTETGRTEAVTSNQM